ncbi:Ribonuclease III [Paramicrosporidium saccamoebae]|uniref:Large ribosomal subunit protein mL44 n=1 Tax=Paramicrosporidium saccamoebae TaxID=1246581 RepID=A0A2H9TF89_9FUNG|nr:Ribonuclease III [Paramicrosporidium saccamoebae]
MRFFRVQRRSLYVGPSVVESVQSVFKKSNRTLRPSETAFSHRLGMHDVPERKFRAALAHPILPRSKPFSSFFEDYKTAGSEVLDIFVRDYVAARFARLPKDSTELAVQVYTTPSNVSAIARSTGIEYALIEFEGIPNISMPTLQAYVNKSSPDRAVNFKPTSVYSDIFMALLGVVFKEKLAHAMQHFHRTEPDYRLLHETGRQSSTSIYVVGVYSHGPSLLVAQERAAVEALRKLFIIDTPTAPRKSDCLLTYSPINTISALRDVLKLEPKRL